MLMSWPVVATMNRKGPGGYRHPGRKKTEKNKIIRRIPISGRTLRFFASPLIVVFIFIRSLAYQIFIGIILIAQYSRRIFTRSGNLQSIQAASPNYHSLKMSKNRGHLGPGEPALTLQKKHPRTKP